MQRDARKRGDQAQAHKHKTQVEKLGKKKKWRHCNLFPDPFSALLSVVKEINVASCCCCRHRRRNVTLENKNFFFFVFSSRWPSRLRTCAIRPIPHLLHKFPLLRRIPLVTPLTIFRVKKVGNNKRREREEKKRPTANQQPTYSAYRCPFQQSVCSWSGWRDWKGVPA